jgi:hypothetical protein
MANFQILATLNLIFGSIDLRKSIEIQDDASKPDDEREDAKRSRYLIIVLLCIASIKFIMGIVLWTGAVKRDSTYVRTWLVVSIILWILLVSDYIAKLATGTLLLATTIITGLTIVVRVLVFFIIFMFIRELETERKERGTPASGELV